MPKRVVKVDKNLYFEYEVAPHRRIQKRIDSISGGGLSAQSELAISIEQTSASGTHIPFKQVRLKGKINPLNPPVHVETVLIGRALGQRTGYLFGVGYRCRDDGYVEGEFSHGTEKFNSYLEFEKAVRAHLPR